MQKVRERFPRLLGGLYGRGWGAVAPRNERAMTAAARLHHPTLTIALEPQPGAAVGAMGRPAVLHEP